MRYNVADLLKSPTGRSRVVAVDEPFEFHLDADPESRVELVKPLRGQARFTRDHQGILVQAVLRTAARMSCIRCLEPVDVDIQLELEEEFLPTVYIPGGPDIVPRGDREPDTEIDEHHVLDLSEVARQAVELSLPMHTLCREACRGLCPQCGANWNETTCDCEPPADPRWQAIREMIEPDH
jgi:uncharacterized protein